MKHRIIALLGIVAPLALARPAEAALPAAQESSWLAWIGCWEGSAEVGGDEAASFVVCFRPLTTGGGVEIRTYTDGDLVSTEQMIADGAAHAVEEGGCTGERTARWSSDGARVFLSSELSCGGGITRGTRGLLSILPGGEAWVEVQSVRAGDGSPLVGIRTFVPAPEDALAAGPILDPTAGIEIAVATARSQAAGALTPDALVEIVGQTGSDVTNAFLIERGEPFGLDRASLVALAARGVPGEVVDVMVAVSYPERFQVAAGEDIAELSPERETGGPAAAPGAWPRRRWFRGYSPWGLGYDPYWDPFFSSSYRLRYGGYGYGYGPYGYGGGYGYGYGPYGYGGLGGTYRAPSLVVIQPPTVTDRTTLSRNRGVVRSGDGGGPSRDSGLSRSPGSGGGAAHAAPRSSGGSSPARAAPSSSRSPAGGGGGSGNVRRARPR